MPASASPLLDPATTAQPADVVYTFSTLTWRAASQRDFFMPEDRLARSLLAHEGLDRLLICDMLRSLPAKLLRDRMGRRTPPFPETERTRLAQPIHLSRSKPTSLRGVARAVATYERALARSANRMGMQRPVLITANPLLAGFGELTWARAVTYYAVDDWSRSPLYGRWWPAYEAAYDRIRARGCRIAAVSPGLRDTLATGEPGILVPNGLEPQEWRGDATPPAFASELDRPVLLYVGTLDGRLRVAWLEQLARALPEATVLLVGPATGEADLQGLERMANVRVHPAITRRRDFAGLVRSADVGLIPHLRSPLTESIEPQKIWEYLAGGLPVVSADLLPVRDIDPRVVLVPDDGDYVAAVRTALSLGRAADGERLAFVDANSWRARHEKLIALALS